MRDVLIFFAVSIPVLLGLQTVWADFRAASPDSAAVLLVSALGWGMYLWGLLIGDYLRERPSIDLILLLALVPVLVTLIYAMVFPVAARFLVARRGAAD
ncbi:MULTISPECIES: hypothetical protein [unclassified Roseovarius]|uniref:hypothetical protein n=1 Tax=unclassified Roseovarius TaxID=2614913 RepID=UPI00273D2CFD|nr:MULTISPECIES: hypothetical protein [unclassified Roseovarius]